jgi:hypothetical protein
METLIIHTEGEKLKTIQNLLKLLDIKYEKKKEKSTYNPEFVKKILNSSKSVKEGNIVKYTPELKQEWFGK